MPIRRLVAIGAVAVFSLIGTTTVAVASSPTGAVTVADDTPASETDDDKATAPQGGAELTPEEAARQAAQAPYMALSEEVWRISEESEPGEVVSGQFEIQSNRYVVNWHGDVPPSLDELVRKAATEQGIEVEIRQTAHSRDELEQAAMELARAVPDPAGLSVTVKPDGSGLSVSWPAVEGQDDLTQRKALDDAVDRTRAQGIDVAYDTTKPRAEDAGREADNSPY